VRAGRPEVIGEWREVLAVAGIFQRLGISSDDVFVRLIVQDDGRLGVNVTPRLKDGSFGPPWRVKFASGLSSCGEGVVGWVAAVSSWNEMSASDRASLVDASEAARGVVGYLAECLCQGVVFATPAATSNLPN